MAGNNVLNASLVPVKQFESSSGISSGFAFVDQPGFRTTVPVVAANATSGGSSGSTSTSSGTASSTAPVAVSSSLSSAAGIIQRLDVTNIDGNLTRATRMAEASLMGTAGIDASPFSRTLAASFDRNSLVNLTVSGFTVLAWNYDASVAPPHIEKVVNAADLSLGLAPGGLVSIFGEQLSPVNLATQEIPLPTALGDSCLTVNGLPVPMLFVSPNQINAQLPFETIGNATLILRTPGGVSDSFALSVQPGAPGVFRSGSAGPVTNIPTILRASNGELVTDSNPVHRGDTLVIYLTGLGQTSPAVGTGLPAPTSPLAAAVNPPQLTMGGVSLPLLYSGLTPGEVGVYQINAKVPAAVPVGLAITLKITQGGVNTSVNLRVVE